MINLKDFKKALGETADTMTEEQILELLENQDKEAEIYFTMWLEKIKKSKSNV